MSRAYPQSFPFSVLGGATSSDYHSSGDETVQTFTPFGQQQQKPSDCLLFHPATGTCSNSKPACMHALMHFPYIISAGSCSHDEFF